MARLGRHNIDFTKGSIYKSIFLFALPIMAGELFQDLYHSTDSLVLGNFVGEAALAAVSVCGSLTNLLIGFCNGMSVGSTVVVSKAFGSGDEKRLKDSVCHTFTFAIFVGLVLSIIGLVFAPLLVRISNVNADVYADALSYFRIFICGIVFTIVYNNSAGILRGMGDIRTPFVVLLVSSITNIVLDILFCAVFGWGIEGVAIATIISQFVSVLISYYVLSRKMGFKCMDIAHTFRNGRREISEMLDVGVAAGFQSSIISFSNLFVWRYINRFSTSVVAGVGVAQRCEKFVALPNAAFGSAVTTYVGQNLGAGDIERAKKGLGAGFALTLGVSFTLIMIVYPNATSMASLFNRSELVLQTATKMMHMIIPFYFVNSSRQVIMGVLRANKRSKMTMVLTLLGMVVTRQIYLAIAMSINSSIETVIAGYPIGWISSLVYTLIYWAAVRKKVWEV